MTGATAAGAGIGQAAEWVVFELDGEAYGLPCRAVEAVASVGPATGLPFAPGAVEGLYNDRGSVIPVLSLRALLRRADSAPPDPGERPCVVVRSSDRRYALRVDRVLFVGTGSVAADTADPSRPMVEGTFEARGRRIFCLSLDRLDLTSLRPNGPPAGPPDPIGVAPADRFAFLAALAARQRDVIAVRVGDSIFGLPLPVVVELCEPLPVTRLPLVTPVLAGISMHRSVPLLIFSLARLLGLDAGEDGGERPATGHVVVRAGGGVLGLAVDEVLGLYRSAPGRGAASSRSAAPHLLEVADLIEPSLLAMVRALPTESPESDGSRPPAVATRSLLCVAIAGRLCALPLEAVDRVTEPRAVMRLPAGAAEAADGAVELGGAMLPLTDGRRWLALGGDGPPAGACVVLHGDRGLHALAVDAVLRIAEVPAPDVVAVADAAGRVSASARIDGRPALVLAVSRLTSAPARQPVTSAGATPAGASSP